MTNQAALSVWNTNDLRNPHCLADKQKRVQKMFGDLAGAYDLVNHVLSLNLDRRWRKKTVELMNLQPGQRVADLCCGTGDLVGSIIKARGDLSQIIGVDFAQPMLHQAIKKYSRSAGSTFHDNPKIPIPKWLCSNAEKTCLQDHYFDRICCAFGVRNMQNHEKFLREIYRLLKPGGRAAILEFALPTNRPLRWAYQCYFRLVLPLVGSIISLDRNRSYHYLAGSVCSFPAPEELKKYFIQAGFGRVEAVPMSGGIVVAYLADKK
jgi:demethylmenaquinone methyltransferase / 2-methoxy-6-polyprenyl-1,4-benzoquinol methylase